MSADSGAAAEYGFVHPTFVHFDDLDSMGMVHNSRYAVLVERTLTAFWEQHGYTHRRGVPTHPDHFVTVAEYSISYKLPVLGTGPILIHLYAERIGRTSVTYGFRVLSEDGKALHAEGRRVHIRLDQETYRPVPWADETRELYETLRPKDAAEQAAV